MTRKIGAIGAMVAVLCLALLGTGCHKDDGIGTDTAAAAPAAPRASADPASASFQTNESVPPQVRAMIEARSRGNGATTAPSPAAK